MSKPRPYELGDQNEVFRLYEEMIGYMNVSLHDGTDHLGRQYAIEGLRELRDNHPRMTEELEKVCQVLGGLKLTKGVHQESEVVDAIRETLMNGGYTSTKEFRLSAGGRIDLYIHRFGIGIEVKKGKPNTSAVISQLLRYSKSPEIKSLILVSERGLRRHITVANNTPVRYVSLSTNWGLTV